MATPIVCPKCGSEQITAHQKGFSGGKALAGDLLLGPVGLLAGTAGNNKIIITCLACGHQFKPGQGKYEAPKYEAPRIYTYEDRKSQMVGVAITALILLLLWCAVKWL